MPSADEIRDAQRATWAGLSAGWEKWDSVIMDQLGPVGAAMIERLDIAEDHQHLDIAAGTGEPGLSIARLAPKGRVVLTDLAPEMLDIAGRRARAQGITNIETKVCSADDLPFDDATFDSVSVRFGYMFFPDMAKATAEFVRVLRPGGRLCSSVWVKPEENPWTTIAMQAIATEAVLAPPDPDGPNMFRCAAPGICQRPVRGRGAARRCRVGRRRRARDAIARGVLGDDQRARLARSCGASAGRRTGAGADSRSRHREGERVREGRQGPRSGPGAVHRGNEVGTRMTDREIRRAHLDEARELAELHARTEIHAYAHIFPADAPPPAVDEHTREFREELLCGTGFVAVVNDGIVGAVLAAPDRSEHGDRSPVATLCRTRARRTGHRNPSVPSMPAGIRGGRVHTGDALGARAPRTRTPLVRTPRLDDNRRTQAHLRTCGHRRSAIPPDGPHPGRLVERNRPSVESRRDRVHLDRRPHRPGGARRTRPPAL